MSSKQLEDRKTAAQALWCDACTAAYHQFAEESGKSIGRIASDMELHQHTLERMVNGSSRWSLDAMLLLAAATSQDPVPMLVREAMPTAAEAAEDCAALAESYKLPGFADRIRAGEWRHGR